METTRQKKVSRLIQKELGESFIKENKQLASGTIISVSKVRISPDLSYAKVYVSIFPSDKQNEIVDNINKRIGLVRRNLGFKVGKQLRIVPELEFFVDDSLDYIENIDRLLK